MGSLLGYLESRCTAAYKQDHRAVLNGGEKIWATVLFGNGLYFCLFELGDQAVWNTVLSKFLWSPSSVCLEGLWCKGFLDGLFPSLVLFLFYNNREVKMMERCDSKQASPLEEK